jgi:3-(3-hydroxy-phenyl)propionate hydroxylase
VPSDSVCIVGAGPAGVIAALSLARHGIPVTLIDADAGPNMSPRAIVYLNPLLPDLDALGILDEMKSRGHIDTEGFNMHLVALDEVLSAPNTVLEGFMPTPFNIHMGQGEFTTLVLEHLARLDNVDVIWGTKVVGLEQDDAGVTLRLEGAEPRNLRADWVVGADGARSVVRTAIGATLEGTTWDERFVATNLRYDFRKMGMKSSNLFVHPELAAVIAQINATGLWRCTFQEDASLPLETLEDRIREYFRKLLGADAEYELVAYQPYKMHQRMATKMREGRVVLVGDAAHLTNPTGGLGLTTGLYDVFLLDEALTAVIEGRADASILDRWAEDRTRVFTTISSPLASGLKRIVYGGLSADELREATQPMRESTATVESQRQMLLGLDGIRSPALLPA